MKFNVLVDLLNGGKSTLGNDKLKTDEIEKIRAPRVESSKKKKEY